MWAILKIDQRFIHHLKAELLEKIGNDTLFYAPKLKIKKFMKQKVLFKESLMLGDYLLCHHKNFSNRSIFTSLKYCKGLKYFLSNFINSQKEIENFINKCRQNEDKEGYIKQTFFDLKKSGKYKFISGPFMNLIFTILEENNLNIKALMGKYKATVSKEDNLFRPV